MGRLKAAGVVWVLRDHRITQGNLFWKNKAPQLKRKKLPLTSTDR